MEIDREGTFTFGGGLVFTPQSPRLLEDLLDNFLIFNENDDPHLAPGI
jgi:hypothetical protein